MVLSAGHTLRPQDIGGLLAVGITEVPVTRRPRVGIVSQGDEVVPPGAGTRARPGAGYQQLHAGGIRAAAGGVPLTYPLAPDEQEALHAAVQDRA